MARLQNLIGWWSGIVFSLFLAVGAFFSAVDEVFTAWIVALLLPVLAVLVLALVLLLPQVGHGFTYAARLGAPAVAFLAAVAGGWGAAAAIALLAVVIWAAHWAGGRRVAGRSIGGVFRDVRYAVEGLGKR